MRFWHYCFLSFLQHRQLGKFVCLRFLRKMHREVLHLSPHGKSTVHRSVRAIQ